MKASPKCYEFDKTKRGELTSLEQPPNLCEETQHMLWKNMKELKDTNHNACSKQNWYADCAAFPEYVHLFKLFFNVFHSLSPPLQFKTSYIMNMYWMIEKETLVKFKNGEKKLVKASPKRYEFDKTKRGALTPLEQHSDLVEHSVYPIEPCQAFPEFRVG